MFNRSRNSGAQKPGALRPAIAMRWYRLSVMADGGASYIVDLMAVKNGSAVETTGKSTGVHPKFSLRAGNPDAPHVTWSKRYYAGSGVSVR